ncbi:MAG: GtrA family protein [Ferruginibacter sp.]
MKQSLTSLLDAFYPPVKRLMPIQTFRYAACGGANTLLGLSIYWVSLHFIFENRIFDFGISALKPHNAALFFSSGIVFFIGFLLNKYIVFTASNLKGRIQLFRYGLSFLFSLTVNYFILQLFVQVFLWKPFISQVITTGIVIAISYMAQKHFTFRTKASE